VLRCLHSLSSTFHLVSFSYLSFSPSQTSTMAKTNDLQKFMDTARERKKNEQLATKIFSSNRRQSAPSKLRSQPGGSLADRVGIKKQRASIGGAANAPKKAKSNNGGDVNGEWTHDLHASVNNPPRGPASSLASRITAPSAAAKNNTPAGNAKQRRAAARKTAALERMDLDDQDLVNVRPAPPSGPAAMGMSIRGLAGPYAVMGHNFAPGTTAADVESAMTPIGGEMESCKIVKEKPFIVVEMVFVSREGGERVIETFNNKTADGRVLKIYPKIGGNRTSAAIATANNNKHTQAKGNNTREQVVDGSMGFPEPNQRLHSDRMLRNDGQGGRGRKNQRGRGGR
jgi:hypothetical protein